MLPCGLIMLDNFRGMDLISWFPCVIAFGISLPFDEILESFRPSVLSVCDDLFDFILFFSVDEIRGWLGEVWAMRSCFMIGGQERCMKYIVNSPIRG